MKFPWKTSTRYACPLIAVNGLMAAALAGYLCFVSVRQHRLPPGCGTGSSCAEVLTSRWSAIGDVPVSGMAAVWYLLVSATVVFLFRSDQLRTTPRMVWVLGTAGTATLLIIAWFLAVQSLILRSYCVWCIADHLLGAIFGVSILCIAQSRFPRDADPAWPRVKYFRWGAAIAGLFIAAQILIPYQGPQVRRLATDRNDDTGPGPQRQIAVLGGRLQLTPADELMLGSPSANTVLVVMLDYCCPHCRRTHEYLRSASEVYGDQLGVIWLPTPLNGKCNPAILETEPRFEHACELARLALTVWRTNPNAFGEFDRWLFEPEQPRNPEEALAKAEELLAGKPIRTALLDPAVDRAIQRNVEAYQQGQIESIPVILSPGFSAIVGRPRDRDELFRLLESELPLGLRTSPTVTP